MMPGHSKYKVLLVLIVVNLCIRHSVLHALQKRADISGLPQAQKWVLQNSRDLYDQQATSER